MPKETSQRQAINLLVVDGVTIVTLCLLLQAAKRFSLEINNFGEIRRMKPTRLDSKAAAACGLQY